MDEIQSKTYQQKLIDSNFKRNTICLNFSNQAIVHTNFGYKQQLYLDSFQLLSCLTTTLKRFNDACQTRDTVLQHEHLQIDSFSQVSCVDEKFANRMYQFIPMFKNPLCAENL